MVESFYTKKWFSDWRFSKSLLTAGLSEVLSGFFKVQKKVLDLCACCPCSCLLFFLKRKETLRLKSSGSRFKI